jgi:TRAP transporter TAXI family solute receptor
MTRFNMLNAFSTVAMVSVACLSAHAEPVSVDILVSPAGSGPYLAVATMQNYASDFTDAIAPKAVETPGFTYNVRYLASQPDLWETTLIGSGQVVEWAAVKGIAPFFPEAMDAVKDFRVLGAMSNSTNLFVALDDEINTLDDFDGKRVAVGLLTQNEWGMHQRMLLDNWGITGNLKSFDALGPGQNIDALLDGRSDIGTLVAHSNFDFSYTLEAAPFKTLESSGRPFHYINIPSEQIQTYIDSTGAPFKIQQVPAGTLTGQGGPVTSFGNVTLISAHKSFPEDLAYEFVKLWIESGPEIGKYSAIAKIWEPKTISEIARTNPELIHPGAMRAYKETGLVD